MDADDAGPDEAEDDEEDEDEDEDADDDDCVPVMMAFPVLRFVLPLPCVLPRRENESGFRFDLRCESRALTVVVC